MSLKKGKTYKVSWIDAFQTVEWTDEDSLNKLIPQYEKGVEQILTFIKESERFYIFTTGTHTGDGNYCDIMMIPKVWVLTIKQLRI